ncbi:hypothetical protein WDZ16_12955 [Pseudokineococcus marinus]|uniref:DUF3168 domain-containing protein n=1 Tax=Pseudokineococcus marinus TaxID=351215 RepID=A0A849BK41_9ACTN|nr:hypothetical protein [Pseudokineococcus marinus]NNH21643.1 hypothetical protein [Pseudokineococcus marinus]
MAGGRYPEATEALRLGLLALPDVAALAGDRVGTEVVGDEPCIQLDVIGGPMGYGSASPLVQIGCWGRYLGDGTDDGSAWQLASAVTADRVGVESIRGELDGGWVAGVGIDLQPYTSPDPTNDRPRYLLTVRMHTSPLE